MNKVKRSKKRLSSSCDHSVPSLIKFLIYCEEGRMWRDAARRLRNLVFICLQTDGVPQGSVKFIFI